jgi:EAL domain-containing protein (putative c-di-GMP-specific phosphodiesterase class I)
MRQGEDLTLAVNVSARNLLEADFADNVLGLLAGWQLPTSCRVLEVTESAIMLDPEHAEVLLAKLSHVGIELAIDDLGASYTSLAQPSERSRSIRRSSRKCRSRLAALSA